MPPQSADELPTGPGPLAVATGDVVSHLRRLVPSGAEFHFDVQWARGSATAYLYVKPREEMNADSAEFCTLQAARIQDKAFPRRLVLVGVRTDIAPTDPEQGSAA